MSRYIQIGVTALRDPGTGEPLPAVPLYVRAEDLHVQTQEEAMEPMLEDAGRELGRLMKSYVEGCRSAGVPI